MYIHLNYDIRFANQLFIIGYYLTNVYNKYDNMLYLNIYEPNIDYILSQNNIKHSYIKYDEYIFPQFSYYQNYKLFDLNKLRYYLTCPNLIKAKIFNEIPNINECIVLHVRRGDYLYEENKNKFITLTIDQYKQLVDEFNLYNENFIIISDDIEWCKKYFNFLDNVYFSENDLLFDFYCLTFSKFNVCSCSSFSLMGSYLNLNQSDHIVPYPYFNFDINDPNLCGEDPNLIIPPNYRRFIINK